MSVDQALSQIGRYVSELREQRNLGQMDVALAAKIHPSVLSKLENGSGNPTLSTLLDLASGLGISIGDLVSAGQLVRGAMTQPIVAFPRTQAERDKLAGTERPENFIPIPLLADPAGLGHGFAIDDARIEGYCLIYRDWLGKGRHYAIRVRGDSMAPTLGDGDIVAVDINDRTPKSLRGKIVAAKIGGGVTIKRFAIREGADRPWYLQADNSDWEREHGQIVAKPRDGMILGKVVWVWRKIG